MRKYVEIKDYSTMKVEASNKKNDFYIVVTAMGEEIQLRLDDKGFYRNIIKKVDQLKISQAVEELKNWEFKLEEWETRTPEQTELLWKRQEELEAQYAIRCDYVVVWLKASELSRLLVDAQLVDEEIGFSKIDEVV